MRTNLTIRSKLIAGFGLLLVLASVFALASIWQIRTLKEVQARTERKFEIIASLDNTMWELRFGFPFYMVTPGRRQAVREANPILTQSVLAKLQDYVNAGDLTEEERLLTERFRTTFSSWAENRLLLFKYFDEGKTEELDALRSGVTVTQATELVKTVKSLRELTSKNNLDRVTETQAKATYVMASVGLILVLGGMAAALYLYRGITVPLRTLQRTVDRARSGEKLSDIEGVRSKDEFGGIWNTVHGLLGEREEAQRKAEEENDRLNQSVVSILQSVHQLAKKDLTVKAPVTSDVVGTVSDSINTLTEETSKVLQDVTQIAGSVAHASNKVKSQAELVSQTAEDERQSVAKMIESLMDATQIMNQVAALAEQSNDSAGRATEVTDNALQTVNGTLRGMETIRETITETEKRIKRLGERSQEISGIVNLINTIAERTHSLALNASISASVAGEAGKGFAVVAEEVQRLAESARHATQQIGTLVNNIQLETNETIGTMSRTINQVMQGTKQAQKAGEQMRMTQQITSELVAQVQRIAEMSDQQRAMSTNLLTAVQTIGQSTERTAKQISAQNEETESLTQSARRLLDSVNVFKLPKMA